MPRDGDKPDRGPPDLDTTSFLRQRVLTDPAHTERWRTLIAHKKTRLRVGKTVLSVRERKREAQIWTLEDGEHLLLLVENGELLHWEGSCGPLKPLNNRACEWLCTPPADSAKPH
jgi:hypothetical protein